MTTNATAVSRCLNAAGVYTATTGWDTYGLFVHRHPAGAQVNAAYASQDLADAWIDRATAVLVAKGYTVTRRDTPSGARSNVLTITRTTPARKAAHR